MSESNLPNLRLLREHHALKQAELAQKLGVHPRTVLRWEAGQQDPNLTDLRKIAAIFGISVGRLVESPDARWDR